MKKKIFTAVFALALSIVLGATVWAAVSAVGGIDMPQASSDQGEVSLTNVTPTSYPQDVQEVVNRLNNAPPESTLQDAFGDQLPDIDLYNADGLLQEKMDLKQFKFLSPVMDLKIEGVTPTEDNPVKVTFVANNMTDNIEVFVLHYCDKHGWELLTTEKISDNQVVANFHSASPVALVYKEKKAATITPTSIPGASGVGGQSGKKSPQTGDMPVVPGVLGIIGLICVGGVAVKRYRSEG